MPCVGGVRGPMFGNGLWSCARMASSGLSACDSWIVRLLRTAEVQPSAAHSEILPFILRGWSYPVSKRPGCRVFMYMPDDYLPCFYPETLLLVFFTPCQGFTCWSFYCRGTVSLRFPRIRPRLCFQPLKTEPLQRIICAVPSLWASASIETSCLSGAFSVSFLWQNLFFFPFFSLPLMCV